MKEYYVKLNKPGVGVKHVRTLLSDKQYKDALGRLGKIGEDGIIIEDCWPCDLKVSAKDFLPKTNK